MKRFVCVLLLAAVLAASCGRGGAKTLPTLAAPPALLPAGYQGLQVQTVCLTVQQSFQETSTTFSLPVEPLVRQVLQGLRLKVMPAGQTCDIDLFVQLTGQPLAKDYICILGTECGHCYTGAEVLGEVRLTASSHDPVSFPFSESLEGPSSISQCPKKPEDAPFDSLWPRAVLGALLEAWGSPVLDAAFPRGDENVRLAAVGLGYKAGLASVPLLVNALSDKSAPVRRSAATCLTYLGEGADEAVPALINLLKDKDERARSAAAGALRAITGQDFGMDQAQWRRWVAEGKPAPTPWTSWEGVIMMPGSRWSGESGTMRAFSVDASCEEVEAFYRAQPAPGGARTDPFGNEKIWAATGADAVQLFFRDATVDAGRPRCTVQFWLNTTLPGPAPPTEAPK